MGNYLSREAFHEHNITEAEIEAQYKALNLFPPPKDVSDRFFIKGADDAPIEIAYYEYPGSNEVPVGYRIVILYSYGNLDSINQISSVYRYLSLHFQVEVVGYNYPGYGKSGGHASEDTVNDAGLRVYDWVKSVLHADAVVLWGKSIGSCPTAYIASERCDDRIGIMFESALASLDELKFKDFSPLIQKAPVLERVVHSVVDPLGLLNNRKRVERYGSRWKGGVVVVHGKEDELIHYSHGVHLADACVAAGVGWGVFVPIPGKHHNDIKATEVAVFAEPLFMRMYELLKEGWA